MGQKGQCFYLPNSPQMATCWTHTVDIPGCFDNCCCGTEESPVKKQVTFAYFPIAEPDNSPGCSPGTVPPATTFSLRDVVYPLL